MKFLFVGCGSIGRRHIQNLKNLIPCEILAYRVRNEALGEFETRHGIRNFLDFEKALDQKPDAVFITNPTRSHISTALKVAQRGIPFFLEKPLSDSLDNVDELISICGRQKLLAFVGHKMRFHRSIRLIKQWIDEGKLGKVISVRAHYGGHLPSWHPWEDYRRQYSSRKDLGGGIVLDATHEIDYLFWWMGGVREVKSFCGKLSPLEIQTEDTADILLRFECGALGSVHMNYFQQPEYRACEVIGTRGTAVWHQYRKVVDLYLVKEKRWQSFPEGESYDSNQDMFIEEMKHFLACLKGKESLLCDLKEGKKVLEIALKAKEGMIKPDRSKIASEIFHGNS